jgi:hypothetical protein
MIFGRYVLTMDDNEADQTLPLWVKFIESELGFPKIERKEESLE